jgi:hypothetical protein
MPPHPGRCLREAVAGDEVAVQRVALALSTRTYSRLAERASKLRSDASPYTGYSSSGRTSRSSRARVALSLS